MQKKNYSLVLNACETIAFDKNPKKLKCTIFFLSIMLKQLFDLLSWTVNHLF